MVRIHMVFSEKQFGPNGRPKIWIGFAFFLHLSFFVSVAAKKMSNLTTYTETGLIASLEPTDIPFAKKRT